jgi:hypothetical protein
MNDDTKTTGWLAHPLNKTEGKATVFYGQERFGGPFGWFTPCGFTRNEMNALCIVQAMDRLIRQSEAARSVA